MRASRAVLAGVALLCSSAVLADEGDFEVKVGGKSYSVTLEKPLKVTTPKGETVELVVSRKKALSYNKAELAFQYPSEMKLSESTEDGVTTITLESPDSPVAVLQVYPASVEPKNVLEALANGVSTEFAGRGGQIKALPAPKRKVSGADRQGKAFDILLAGEQLQIELFAWKEKGKTRGVMLQHMQKESELANAQYDVILSSLK
jgi:hypothetical protein